MRFMKRKFVSKHSTQRKVEYAKTSVKSHSLNHASTTSRGGIRL